MLLHRVAWVDPKWQRLAADAPGHPLYVPVERQGGGRFDNPGHYVALYTATTPQAAVGETFGNLASWPSSEITRTKDGRPRCLVTLELRDSAAIADLDNPRVLSKLGLRPTDVVRRNREHTQEVALELWMEREKTGFRGIRWWSYWRPEWEIVMLWSDGLTGPWFPDVSVAEVATLTAHHAAVELAAEVLPRVRVG